jgi:hypothetical protein
MREFKVGDIVRLKGTKTRAQILILPTKEVAICRLPDSMDYDHTVRIPLSSLEHIPESTS